VLRVHIFPIGIIKRSYKKRFSMSGNYPTNDLDLMAKSFEKIFQTIKKLAEKPYLARGPFFGDALDLGPYLFRNRTNYFFFAFSNPK